MAEKTLMLDRKMREVFDWSPDDLPIRDALWNHYMEENGHNTLETEEAMKPTLNMSDEEVKALAEKLLKLS